MDSLSQMVLGASVGYAIAGKQHGKKALLWGAALGTLPDLDFIPSLPFDDELLYLKTHRGITHSILFALIAPIGLSWWLHKWKGFNKVLMWQYGFWIFLTHSLLDTFTTWGTQIIWPHPHRASWNILFIADPLYTLPFIFFLVLAILYKNPKLSRILNSVGLTLSSLYIVWAFGVKMYMNTQFEAVFNHYNLPIERYTTRPTAFNTVLWSTTAETKDGYYYGMISLFDSKKPNPLYFTPKQHHLLEGFEDQRTKDLLFITNGYFTVEKQENGIMIHDLRYGFMGNPHKHGPLHVFSYQLWKDENGNTQFDTIDPQRRTNTRSLLGELWQRLKGI